MSETTTLREAMARCLLCGQETIGPCGCGASTPADYKAAAEVLSHCCGCAPAPTPGEG